MSEIAASADSIGMKNETQQIISPTGEQILRYLDDSDQAHTAHEIGTALSLPNPGLVAGATLRRLRLLGFVYFAPADAGPDRWYCTAEGHEALFQIDLNAELRRKGLIE